MMRASCAPASARAHARFRRQTGRLCPEDGVSTSVRDDVPDLRGSDGHTMHPRWRLIGTC